MNNPRLVIVDGVRTPFSKMGTDLAGLAADDLGRVAVDALLSRTGLDPALIDEVIIGCVAQPIEAANVARVIALRAGIPEHVPAVTVHRNCASGIEAVTQAAQRFGTGEGSVFVVGGTESMSHIPFLLKQSTAEKLTALSKAKSAMSKLSVIASLGPSDLQPRVGLKLGLTDPVCGLNMGETAEVLAREFHISRESQDAFALQSHQRAIAGRARLAEEICPVYPGPEVPETVLQDNGPREAQSAEALAGLNPVFDPIAGSVTAGNSSQITDGAAALLVMSEERASELNFTPIAAIGAYAYAGCDPRRMGLGPVYAIDKLLSRSRLTLQDADVVEINEAFAVQVLAVLECLRSPNFARDTLKRTAAIGEIPPEKLNPNGGAIALGHPVGASGARLILTAARELARRNGKRALVSVCVGGGQGAALWLERI